MKKLVEYLPVLILGLAVLFNMIVVEVHRDNFFVWYHVTHKLQLTLVALAGITYKPNRINRFAFIAYISIILVNWFVFYFFNAYGGHGVTAITFIVSIFIVNWIEPKGKV